MATTPRSPGIHQEVLSHEDGRALRFTVSVPSAAPGPRPLVLVLHYGVQGDTTPPFYGRAILETLAVPALSDLGAILVAPDSIGWDWTLERNESAALAVLDHVLETEEVDARRVLVIGYSMGGIGAWHFASKRPERFAAAIPMGARPVESAEARIPVRVLHSRDDELLALALTEAHVDELRKGGADVSLVILEGITHYETAKFVGPLGDCVPWIRRAFGDPEA